MKKVANQKDRTKYQVGEFIFSTKNAVAHQLISMIAKKYTWKQLNDLFELNEIWYESFICCAPLEVAKERSKKYARYLLNPADILTDKNGNKFAVCNQWSIWNLPQFIKFFKLQFKIEVKVLKAV